MDRSCPLQNAQPWGAKLKATRAISPSHGSCMVLLRGSSWKYSIKNCLVVGTVAVRSRADGDQEQAQSTEPVVLEGVDALVQEPVLRAAEDQRERLPLRQVSACGQGRGLDQLHGNRAARLGRDTKLGTNPRGEIRETCGAQVHWRPPLATRRTHPRRRELSPDPAELSETSFAFEGCGTDESRLDFKEIVHRLADKSQRKNRLDRKSAMGKHPVCQWTGTRNPGPIDWGVFVKGHPDSKRSGCYRGHRRARQTARPGVQPGRSKDRHCDRIPWASNAGTRGLSRSWRRLSQWPGLSEEPAA